MTMRRISTGGLIAIATAALFLTVLTSGLLTASQTVPSTGTVSTINVGVYTDASCTANCTSINWGTLAPGSTTTRTIYVRNAGSIPVTLSMATANWLPSNANNYMTLTWNRANYALAAGASVQATFTLTASASAGSISGFNFNIVVMGSG